MSKQSAYYSFALSCAIMLISACKPEQTAQPVKDFNLDKYLGTWYEIARIDNRFERGCENVTATYSLRKEGGVNVVNKCVKNDGKQKESKGKAFFRGAKDVGALKVSFCWPFYGKYNVLYLDSNYEYAIVGGGSEKYFWILSRTKTLPDATLADLVKKGRELGFPTEKLHYTKQI